MEDCSTNPSQASLDPLKPPTPPEPPPEGTPVDIGVLSRMSAYLDSVRAARCCYLSCYDSEPQLVPDGGGAPEQWTVQVSTCCRTTTMTITTAPPLNGHVNDYAVSQQGTPVRGISVRGSPVRGISVSGSPVRGISVSSSPVRSCSIIDSPERKVTDTPETSIYGTAGYGTPGYGTPGHCTPIQQGTPTPGTPTQGTPVHVTPGRRYVFSPRRTQVNTSLLSINYHKQLTSITGRKNDCTPLSVLMSPLRTRSVTEKMYVFKRVCLQPTSRFIFSSFFFILREELVVIKKTTRNWDCHPLVGEQTKGLSLHAGRGPDRQNSHCNEK